MIELEVAIVDAVVAKLLADVANLDTRKRFEGVKISHWNDERLHTVIRLINYAARKDNCMCSLHAKISRPELSSLDRRSVNHELISIKIERGRRLDTGDIRAVAELSLSVAANDLPVVEQRQIVAHLLLASQVVHRLGEHLHVKCHWVGACEQIQPVEVLALLVRVGQKNLAELGVGHDHLEAIPPLCERLHPFLLVEVGAGFQLRVLSDSLLEKFEFPSHIRAKQSDIGLVQIEVTLCALSQEHRIYDSALDATTKYFRVELLLFLALSHLV